MIEVVDPFAKRRCVELANKRYRVGERLYCCVHELNRKPDAEMGISRIVSELRVGG